MLIKPFFSPNHSPENESYQAFYLTVCTQRCQDFGLHAVVEPNITAEDITQIFYEIAHEYHEVRVIDFIGLKFTPSVMALLIAKLMQTHKIYMLRFEEIIQGLDLTKLAELVTRNPTIRILSLHQITVDQASSELFAKAIRQRALNYQQIAIENLQAYNDLTDRGCSRIGEADNLYRSKMLLNVFIKENPDCSASVSDKILLQAQHRSARFILFASDDADIGSALVTVMQEREKLAKLALIESSAANTPLLTNANTQETTAKATLWAYCTRQNLGCGVASATILSIGGYLLYQAIKPRP